LEPTEKTEEQKIPAEYDIIRITMTPEGLVVRTIKDMPDEKVVYLLDGILQEYRRQQADGTRDNAGTEQVLEPTSNS